MTSAFPRRLADLRALLADDPATTGDQGLKLLEEYLEALALAEGFGHDQGSIARYAQYLRGRSPLATQLLDQAERYAQIRNCLAHSYGLQTSPALAGEIVAFLSELIAQDEAAAAALMSRNVRTIIDSAPLREARDLMLREGLNRLPVTSAGRIIGLLLSRDLVIAEASVEQHSGLIDGLSVAQALPAQARKRAPFIAATAPYGDVVAALRRPGVEALLVTQSGRADQRLLGIITHADVLARM